MKYQSDIPSFTEQVEALKNVSLSAEVKAITNKKTAKYTEANVASRSNIGADRSPGRKENALEDHIEVNLG